MRAVLLAFALVACSKSETKPEAKPDKPDKMDHDHEGMPPALDKFHAVLGPRWHAPKGDQRMKDTCAAIPDFTTAAAAVDNGKPLVDAVAALDATCKANDATAFETAFGKVHEAFHALLEKGH